MRPSRDQRAGRLDWVGRQAVGVAQCADTSVEGVGVEATLLPHSRNSSTVAGAGIVGPR